MRVSSSGIYSGAEGPSEDGPINWFLPVCQGKQPLITPAVVFMLLYASALHHPVAFALCSDQSPPPLSCSRCYCTTTLTHPHCCHPPFLITFALFSLWQNEMGHSAASAFQHHPHADIPLHKQFLTAVFVQECLCVRVRACMCVHIFVFFNLTLYCLAQSYQHSVVELSLRDFIR